MHGVVLKMNGPILSITDVPQLLQNRLSVNKLCFRKERDTNLLKKNLWKYYTITTGV